MLHYNIKVVQFVVQVQSLEMSRVEPVAAF